MADIQLTVTENSIAVSLNESETVGVNIQEPETVAVSVFDNGGKGDAGDPGLLWRGDWDNATAYVVNDAVQHSGSSWICILGNTSQTPGIGSSYWDLLAEKSDGATLRGAWQTATTYFVDDVVSDNGSSWRCILQHSSHQPPNATYWELFVSKGDKGDAGTGVVWLGDWSNATAYVLNDAVQHNGSAYVCNTAHTNQEPPNASYWDLLAGGLNETGSWSNATAYKVRDLATEDGTTYVCILDHTNQQPPNATYWRVFASKGDTGPTGNELLYGSSDPTTEGKDGDSFINETTRVLWLNKGSSTPGSWTGTTQIPLAANPNGCRLTTSGNSQNPNASTAIAIEWNNSVFKDSGITHSTGTNPSRIGPATDKGGRYEIFVAINYNSPSAARINLNLWIRKNGTTDLSSDGQTFGGYSRNSGGSVTSTAFLHWTGELLDTDYLEVMSEQGDIAGTVAIMDDSFVSFKQTTLLENQAGGGSSYGWGSWTDISTITAGWNDTHNAAEYRVSDDGNDVELRGVLQRTGGSSVVGATLPSGARPPSGYNTPSFITANKSTLGSVYVQILTNGDIQFSGFSTNNFLELGGIRFQTSRT